MLTIHSFLGILASSTPCCLDRPADVRTNGYTSASKSQDTATVLGSQGYMEQKMGSEPMSASNSRDSAYMPLTMTFGSHVEKTCDAPGFKATCS